MSNLKTALQGISNYLFIHNKKAYGTLSDVITGRTNTGVLQEISISSLGDDHIRGYLCGFHSKMSSRFLKLELLNEQGNINLDEAKLLLGLDVFKDLSAKELGDIAGNLGLLQPDIDVILASHRKEKSSSSPTTEPVRLAKLGVAEVPHSKQEPHHSPGHSLPIKSPNGASKSSTGVRTDSPRQARGGLQQDSKQAAGIVKIRGINYFKPALSPLEKQSPAATKDADDNSPTVSPRPLSAKGGRINDGLSANRLSPRSGFGYKPLSAKPEAEEVEEDSPFEKLLKVIQDQSLVVKKAISYLESKDDSDGIQNKIELEKIKIDRKGDNIEIELNRQVLGAHSVLIGVQGLEVGFSGTVYTLTVDTSFNPTELTKVFMGAANLYDRAEKIKEDLSVWEPLGLSDDELIEVPDSGGKLLDPKDWPAGEGRARVRGGQARLPTRSGNYVIPLPSSITRVDRGNGTNMMGAGPDRGFISSSIIAKLRKLVDPTSHKPKSGNLVSEPIAMVESAILFMRNGVKYKEYCAAQEQTIEGLRAQIAGSLEDNVEALNAKIEELSTESARVRKDRDKALREVGKGARVTLEAERKSEEQDKTIASLKGELSAAGKVKEEIERLRAEKEKLASEESAAVTSVRAEMMEQLEKHRREIEELKEEFVAKQKAQEELATGVAEATQIREKKLQLNEEDLVGQLDQKRLALRVLAQSLNEAVGNANGTGLFDGADQEGLLGLVTKMKEHHASSLSTVNDANTALRDEVSKLKEGVEREAQRASATESALENLTSAHNAALLLKQKKYDDDLSGIEEKLKNKTDELGVAISAKDQAASDLSQANISAEETTKKHEAGLRKIRATHESDLRLLAEESKVALQVIRLKQQVTTEELGVCRTYPS